jgi:pyrroline-5-carboxylate reductase
MKICLIGGGTMGEAIINRLLSKKVVKKEDIVVSDISQTRLEFLSSKYGVRVLSDNKKAIEGTDLILLAVKPQNLEYATRDIGDLSPNQLVLSIMAGTNLSILHSNLNHPCIIRAMPNMPAQIGEGIIIWTATAKVNHKQKDMAQTIFKALGEEIYVDNEKYIDMATALSGSGPAYVFLFIEALVDAGVHIGLPRDTAQKLVVETVTGSTHTVQKTGKHPAELRNMVTSPGGTTTDALFHLEKGGFRSLLMEAVAAAFNKARKL